VDVDRCSLKADLGCLLDLIARSVLLLLAILRFKNYKLFSSIHLPIFTFSSSTMDGTPILSSFAPYDGSDHDPSEICGIPAIFCILSLCEIAKVSALSAVISTLGYLVIATRANPSMDLSLQATLLILATFLVLTIAMHLKLWRMKLGKHITRHFKTFISIIFSCDALLSGMAILLTLMKPSQTRNIWSLMGDPLADITSAIRRIAMMSKVMKSKPCPFEC